LWRDNTAVGDITLCVEDNSKLGVITLYLDIYMCRKKIIIICIKQWLFQIDCYIELLALGRKIDIFKIIYRVACPVQEVSFLTAPKIEHCLMREF